VNASSLEPSASYWRHGRFGPGPWRHRRFGPRPWRHGPPPCWRRPYHHWSEESDTAGMDDYQQEHHDEHEETAEMPVNASFLESSASYWRHGRFGPGPWRHGRFGPRPWRHGPPPHWRRPYHHWSEESETAEMDEAHVGGPEDHDYEETAEMPVNASFLESSASYWRHGRFGPGPWRHGRFGPRPWRHGPPPYWRRPYHHWSEESETEEMDDYHLDEQHDEHEETAEMPVNASSLEVSASYWRHGRFGPGPWRHGRFGPRPWRHGPPPYWRRPYHHWSEESDTAEMDDYHFEEQHDEHEEIAEMPVNASSLEPLASYWRHGRFGPGPWRHGRFGPRPWRHGPPYWRRPYHRWS